MILIFAGVLGLPYPRTKGAVEAPPPVHVVVVVKSNLPVGTVLGPDNVERQLRSSAPRGAATDLSEVEGMTLGLPLAAGEIVELRELRTGSPTGVTKGRT
jgi:flagella basal body P-ring formation protein FlgA